MLQYSLIVLILTTLILQSRTYAAPGLKLTLSTEYQIYGLSDTIVANGTLTLNDIPVADGLVAIEVIDPTNTPFTFRTAKTGSITPTNCPVNFTQFYPSDSNGNPKYTFKKGSNLWIFYEAKNHDSVNHKVIITISIHNPENIPIYATFSSTTTLEPGRSITLLFLALPITTDLTVGTYKIYANAYSDLPKNFGYPYCPEQTATFTVTDLTSGSSMNLQKLPIQSLQTNGTYTSSFKLPRIGRIGTYTIYVGTRYQGEIAFSSMGIPVVIIGDINGDGIVELMDFFYMSTAYNSEPGDPNWNEKCDIYPWPYGDDHVELMDFWLISLHYGDQALT
jgi:hypothetical protein